MFSLTGLSSRWLIIALLVVLAGCSTTPAGKSDLLDFLVIGVTTKEDTLLQLGEPHGQYQHGDVLAYKLNRDKEGYVIVGPNLPWFGQFNLMLAFDNQGKLKRFSLVEFAK